MRQSANTVISFTGSRSEAFVGISYRDLRLFVVRVKNTGEVALGLHLLYVRVLSVRR